MLNYVSTKGGVLAVDFETAVLRGFAEDGGMFVPEYIPKISKEKLKEWKGLSFNDLAFQIVSLYIDESIIPENDLKKIIEKSTSTFKHPDIVPVVQLKSDSNHYLMELFHGPTLSFKDVAMGFLINIMDYFLERKGEKVSLLLATTGDTGPAAAYACMGKKTIDCWPLFPTGFISDEQARQMTTIQDSNIHSISVNNCPSGGDDIDAVISEIFSNLSLVKELKLSSVNSINWCRVMFQSIHYFYGYFKVAENIDEKIIFSVPTGAFGNLFAGYLAREMGLPVKEFICANNINGTVHRVLESNIFSREKIKKTPSNAIDIVLPYNFWRFLYFISGRNSSELSKWMDEYTKTGKVEFDSATMESIKNGFTSFSVSNEETLSTILEMYEGTDKYLLDPHGAVAVSAVKSLKSRIDGRKVISLLTAHPAKFPDVIYKAFNSIDDFPKEGKHFEIESLKNKKEKYYSFNCETLKDDLIGRIKELKN